MIEKTDLKTTSGTCVSEISAKPFLATASAEELSAFIKRAGESTYRAKQIYDWVNRKYITDPAQMTNISAAIKEKLREEFVCSALKVEKTEECADGSRKLLISLPDHETIECAILGALDGRTTFCLSTQVGCPVRCVFCASGASGFVRNLTAGEIVEQYLLCCRLVKKAPDNVVIMGIGEPLLNFDNLVKALETICNPDGIALAARGVTMEDICREPILLREKGSGSKKCVSAYFEQRLDQGDQTACRTWTPMESGSLHARRRRQDPRVSDSDQIPAGHPGNHRSVQTP